MNDDATLALKIDQLMRRFHSEMHPRAQRVDREKVGPIGGMILFVISENEGVTAQRVGAILGRDKSQVSRITSLLVQKGLVEKVGNQKDARQIELYLTEAGKLQVAAFNGVLFETTKEILRDLNRAERDQFSNLLSKILASEKPE